METISNAASIASKAIWGDPTQNKSGIEPRNGETGDTAAGEPYDAGNKDEYTSGESMQNTKSDIPSTTFSNTDAPGNTASTGPIRPEHDQDKTGVTSAHEPASGFSSDKPTSSNDSSGPGANPSVSADPSSAQQDTTKQQGADRPEDSPAEGSSEHQRILEAKKEAEEAQKVDLSGPGPQPLAESNGMNARGPTSTEEAEGPQKESRGEGTGEKWIKSSGMKADGGDFDAAAAGAGREADRLLDDKGVSRSLGADKSDDSPDPLVEKTGKLSLGDKIKAKLHRDKGEKGAKSDD